MSLDRTVQITNYYWLTRYNFIQVYYDIHLLSKELVERMKVTAKHTLPLRTPYGLTKQSL